jgi:hypothetical protein
VTPTRLFHYKRFDQSHLISLLSEGKLKLSRPDQFNDPWDCSLHYHVPTEPEEIERYIQHWKEINRKSHPEISEVKRALGAYKIKSDPTQLKNALLQMETQLYKWLCDRYRIYCLSEKSNVPLMWSHYAAAHTGICLEFDTNHPLFGKATIKITYLSTYPSLDLVNNNAEALFTKSADWSYEAEWRLIAQERMFAPSSEIVTTDDDFLRIPSGVLKAVIIGCRTDIKTQGHIETLIRTHAPNVVVRKATLARDKYELVIEPPA